MHNKKLEREAPQCWRHGQTIDSANTIKHKARLEPNWSKSSFLFFSFLFFVLCVCERERERDRERERGQKDRDFESLFIKL